jgi:hypothetical protein
MMRRVASLAPITFGCLAMAVLVTWPQAAHMSTRLVSHDDPYFSIWRLSWMTHALAVSPHDVFNGNTFYPTKTTLAFSDATFLQGLIAAPLLWMGVSQVLVYNVLFLAGFVGSGVAMFVLVRYLTGAAGPAVIAATIFTMAPYRIEHAMHLELQWTMWMPLAFWAAHRAASQGARRYGILTGVFLWLQVMSCVYYGVFLGITLMAFVPIVIAANGRRGLRTLPNLVFGAIVGAALTAPYALAYYQASQNVGTRDPLEVLRYSARPISYAASAATSWLWGWTANRWGDGELRLYPGLVVLALVAIGVTHRARRWVLAYGVVTVVAVAMSLGMNNPAYRWLAEHVPALLGFRAPARFAILAVSGLAVLAAFGVHVLLERAHAARSQSLIVAGALAAIAVDFAQRPLELMDPKLTPVAPVYQILAASPPGVVVELPMPKASMLPGPETLYAAWSTSHWRPLLNGYSGYYPRDYITTLHYMETFPDDAAMERLRERDVKYIIVHQALMKLPAHTDLLLKLALRPDVQHFGRYADAVGPADIFVLK